MGLQQTLESMIASLKVYEDALAKGTKLRMQTPEERLACPSPDWTIECELTEMERDDLQNCINNLKRAIRERQDGRKKP